jgi:hypothetical protein
MSKSMKKKSSNAMFNKLVNNKITLYIVAIIAFITLIGNIMNSEVSAIFLFFLAGGVAYSFTKNMTIVLGSSIISTSVATMLSSYFVYKEGLEGLEDISDPSNNNISSNKKGSSKKVRPMKKVSADENIPSKTSNSDNAEALTQLSPALFNNIPNKDQMQKQLGKATEMEQAYDNLEKIMGKDNIQSISTDTKDLIKQQNELIKQLKTMTPALNEAMSSIGNLDLSKLTNMFSSATKTLSDLKTE